MPDWRVEVWVAVITGVSGVLFGAAGLVVAIIATKHADEANEIAKQALKVQERGVDAQIGSDWRSRSADLRVLPEVPLMENRRSATIRIKNRGPSDADDTTVTLHHRDRTHPMDGPQRIPVGEVRAFTGSLSHFPTNPGTAMELRVTYSDGNGDQVLRKGAIIGPGARFSEREWTIEDWPDEA